MKCNAFDIITSKKISKFGEREPKDRKYNFVDEDEAPYTIQVRQ